jgi:hypothetical protein
MSSQALLYFPLTKKTLIADESRFYQWKVQQCLTRQRTTKVNGGRRGNQSLGKARGAKKAGGRARDTNGGGAVFCLISFFHPLHISYKSKSILFSSFFKIDP